MGNKYHETYDGLSYLLRGMSIGHYPTITRNDKGKGRRRLRREF